MIDGGSTGNERETFSGFPDQPGSHTRGADKQMSHTSAVLYAGRIAITAAMLIAAALLASCYWQPDGREATATLTLQAYDLGAQAVIRVRFYEGTPPLAHINELEGQFGGLSYQDGLQQLSPAYVAGATEHTFSVSGSGGTLTIAGIPANTPYSALLERVGAHDSRLGALELGPLGSSANGSEYAGSLDFLSHVGFSGGTFTVPARGSATVEIRMSQSALGTLRPVDGNGNPLISDGESFFELIAVPNNYAISIEHLVGTGGNEEYISPWLINQWYEESVREHVVRPVSAADNGTDDPRELTSPWGEVMLVRAVLPGRRFQLIATNVENRALDAAFGGGGIVGVSEPFTLRPGETRDLEISIHMIGQVFHAPL
ncbi:MAG: hypothetical protein EA404_15055 [Spirochaetaceae bacterium]|nr:MAG: hypothetical protein EA404_15055 [Spirochaetaceae bacterium]